LAESALKSVHNRDLKGIVSRVQQRGNVSAVGLEEKVRALSSVDGDLRDVAHRAEIEHDAVMAFQ
jgi:hypothetical protein